MKKILLMTGILIATFSYIGCVKAINNAPNEPIAINATQKDSINYDAYTCSLFQNDHATFHFSYEDGKLTHVTYRANSKGSADEIEIIDAVNKYVGITMDDKTDYYLVEMDMNQDGLDYLKENFTMFNDLEDCSWDSIKNILESNGYNCTSDKLGLELTAKDVSKTGMTITFTQMNANPTGSLETGNRYWIEKLVTKGQPHWETLITEKELAWEDIAYIIKKNSTTEMQINWSNLYGELPEGSYRLRKPIMDFRGTGDYDDWVYCVYFSID